MFIGNTETPLLNGSRPAIKYSVRRIQLTVNNSALLIMGFHRLFA